MTEKQKAILQILRDHEEPMTKSELLEHFETWYYHNSSKHLGDVLARMVNSGLLHRPKHGYYALGNNGKETNQMTLF